MTHQHRAALAVAIGIALAPLFLVVLPYIVWCVVVLAAVAGAI